MMQRRAARVNWALDKAQAVVLDVLVGPGRVRPIIGFRVWALLRRSEINAVENKVMLVAEVVREARTSAIDRWVGSGFVSQTVVGTAVGQVVGQATTSALNGAKSMIVKRA